MWVTRHCTFWMRTVVPTKTSSRKINLIFHPETSSDDIYIVKNYHFTWDTLPLTPVLSLNLPVKSSIWHFNARFWWCNITISLILFAWSWWYVWYASFSPQMLCFICLQWLLQLYDNQSSRNKLCQWRQDLSLTKASLKRCCICKTQTTLVPPFDKWQLESSGHSFLYIIIAKEESKT